MPGRTEGGAGPRPAPAGPEAMPAWLYLGAGSELLSPDALAEVAEGRTRWYRDRYVRPARRQAAGGAGREGDDGGM